MTPDQAKKKMRQTEEMGGAAKKLMKMSEDLARDCPESLVKDIRETKASFEMAFFNLKKTFGRLKAISGGVEEMNVEVEE